MTVEQDEAREARRLALPPEPQFVTHFLDAWAEVLVERDREHFDADMWAFDYEIDASWLRMIAGYIEAGKDVQALFGAEEVQ